MKVADSIQRRGEPNCTVYGLVFLYKLLPLINLECKTSTAQSKT